MTPPHRSSLTAPTAQLPLRRSKWGPQAWVSLATHALVVFALIWRGRALVEGGGGGGRGPRGGGGGERAVQFLTLPQASPMSAVELPPVPPVTLTPIPVVEAVALSLSPIDVAPPLLGTQSQVSGAGEPGSGGGRGAGSGPGSGSASGPGTGGEESYILPPDPRGAILPPMDGVPRAVRGRPHRVTWWVAADGRIERVEVSPKIADEKYRHDFEERMRSYQFEPARMRDGRHVAGVVTLTITP